MDSADTEHVYGLRTFYWIVVLYVTATENGGRALQGHVCKFSSQLWCRYNVNQKSEMLKESSDSSIPLSLNFSLYQL